LVVDDVDPELDVELEPHAAATAPAPRTIENTAALLAIARPPLTTGFIVMLTSRLFAA